MRGLGRRVEENTSAPYVVTLPAGSVTATANCAPLSPATVAGVV